jgi:hypothetical protein
MYNIFIGTTKRKRLLVNSVDGAILKLILKKKGGEWDVD